MGFAINADQLMVALNRQKIDIPVDYNNKLVLYRSELHKEALTLASDMRGDGKNVILMRKRSSVTEDGYIEYAKRMGVDEVYFMQTQKKTKIVNVADNTVREL